jgi:hypothetical protein
MTGKTEMETAHKEEYEVASESDREVDLSRVETVQIDNYHGLTLKAILVYAVQARPMYLKVDRC